MCICILAVLPPRADYARADELAQAYGLQLEPFCNFSIQQRLEPGEQQFWTTTSHCDCATALGRDALDADEKRHKSPEDRLDDKIAQFRRRGWSKAKIEHWLEQRERTSQRDSRVFESRSDRTRTLDEWRAFLADVTAQASPWIGLILHCYSGQWETEKVPIRDRVHVNLRTADETTFTCMRQDVLYAFHR